MFITCTVEIFVTSTEGGGPEGAVERGGSEGYSGDKNWIMIEGRGGEGRKEKKMEK